VYPKTKESKGGEGRPYLLGLGIIPEKKKSHKKVRDWMKPVTVEWFRDKIAKP